MKFYNFSIQIIRKLLIKIKRWFFYKSYGFYPEDIWKLNNADKYFDKIQRADKTCYDYIKEFF